MTTFYRPEHLPARLQEPIVDAADGFSFWRGLRNAAIVCGITWAVGMLFALWVTS